MKLHTGDTIKVTLGKDKGKSGQVVRVLADVNKVVIDGVNLYKKHTKPMGDQKGGVVELPRPLDVAKVQLVCPNCKKVTRVGFTGKGKDKVRICKKCGKPLTTKTETKKK